MLLSCYCHWECIQIAAIFFTIFCNFIFIFAIFVSFKILFPNKTRELEESWNALLMRIERVKRARDNQETHLLRLSRVSVRTTPPEKTSLRGGGSEKYWSARGSGSIHMHPTSTPHTIRPVLHFANLYPGCWFRVFPWGKKKKSFFSKCLLSWARVIEAHKQTFVSSLTDARPELI